MLGATPATDLALPTSNGRRPVVGRHLHRASEEQQTNRQSVVVFGPQRAAERFEEEEPHPSSTQLAWLQRAPRALAGRRRTRDSWILLARSLEGTKRKGARGHSGVTWPHHPSSPRPAAGPMKTLWSSSSAALFPRLVLNQRLRHHVQRAQSHQSDDAGSKAHCPDSSTCDALIRNQEKPSPVHPPNAGAPSSELSSVAQSTESKQMGQHDGGTTHLHTADSQPNNHCVLTH
ncbi:uncharacterized protein LOC133471430 isoform X2 [Phyllopteryx taeniolatus]|uniref:uncharacterized protein LOC133471430 isoform X2 n=1 Tax=Phyllopteryx taeniolatus TaxID=161469 RepID=UPI002AD23F90|nr:uncharacterized protein LOC133471430 isoform X2 [Phyllopteryx taeniolatus]